MAQEKTIQNGKFRGKKSAKKGPLQKQTIQRQYKRKSKAKKKKCDAQEQIYKKVQKF